ncbi:MAG: 5'/3'-nucleotidase SurE [Bacilli bacterium]
MHILVTNDDSINGEGLKVLAQASMKLGKVTVIAPKNVQSGKSHALSLRNPMEFKKINDIIPGVDTYVLDGTPAECVRVGVNHLHHQYDLVFSGVNKGFNLGEDNFYSGTFAAAHEAVLLGIKAIAFSTHFSSFSGAERYLDEIMKYIFDEKLLEINPLYGVNIPLESRGIKFCAQGNTHFDITYVAKGDIVQGVGFPQKKKDNTKYSDVDNTYQGYTTIVPFLINITNYKILEKLINK